MTINKQALREAALHAKISSDWGCDADNFHDRATPDAVLSLLDELEAAENRVTGNTYAIQLVEVRLTTAEGKIVTLRSDVDYLLGEVVSIESTLADHDTRITQAEDDISNIQSDYVSKSATAAQALLSSLVITTSLSVDGLKVIGPRQTGWTTGTGTPNKAAFNADQALPVGAAYSQAEVQAIATALIAERQRTLALEQALRTHGLID